MEKISRNEELAVVGGSVLGAVSSLLISLISLKSIKNVINRLRGLYA